MDAGRRAVELTQGRLDDLSDGALTAYGRALYFAGELEEARGAALRALEHSDVTRRVPTLIHARATLAMVAVEEGRLSSAQAHADKAKELVGRIGTGRSWLGAEAAWGMRNGRHYPVLGERKFGATGILLRQRRDLWAIYGSTAWIRSSARRS